MSAAGCALGLAPHSGWAVAVVLGGSAAQPRVIARERLELADECLPGSRQPYHTLELQPLSEARRELARYEAAAAELSATALRLLLARTGLARAAVILDSSGRTGADLAATLASHALIHTADGNHFRAALEAALTGLAVPVTRIPQRELLARAAAALALGEAQLTAGVAALGRAAGAPWGADQKAAALAAWLLLA
jgi:hypothetical protein